MDGRVVLVDAMVIIEAHRTGCLKALTSGHAIETVETCFAETQTGAQRRRPEQRIDHADLRARLAAVRPVSDADRAAVFVRDYSASNLDAGERDLWAHALTRADAWLLCGPDISSLRYSVRLGLGDRLVALETLLQAIGHRPREALRRNYTRAWHADTVARMAAEEARGPA
jgi:hypothetical protein